MRALRIPFLISAAALASATVAGPALSTTVVGHAGVEILEPLLAEEVSVLSFGGVMASAQGGNVTIAPDGDRICGAALYCSGVSAPGLIAVTGSSGTQVQVAMEPLIYLVSAASGAEPMAVTLVLESAILAIGDGPVPIRVGGTLSVGENQMPAHYFGSYEVAIEYQ